MTLRSRSLILFAAVAFVAAAVVHRAETRRAGMRAARSGLAPLFLPVQLRGTQNLGVGKLLVASRSMGDPRFRKSVVLLVHADEDAVVGLILNQRSDLPISSALGLKAAKDRADTVYVGGPVSPAAVFALYQSAATVDKAEHVFGKVYLIKDKDLFEQTLSTRPAPGVFHVYLGYAGWTPAQLQHEVQLGAWYILPADTDTVFTTDPDSVWPAMIQRTKSELAQAGLFAAGPQPAAVFWFGSFGSQGRSAASRMAPTR